MNHMNVIKFLSAFTVSFLLYGCSAGRTSTDGALAPGNDVVLEVQFLDSRTFDSNLSDALGNQPWRVIVTPVAPFSVNEIPERLDKWLYVVQDSGGTVLVQEEPEEIVRGGIAGGLGVAIEIAKYVIEKREFGKARNYNVTLLHDMDGQVQMVTFERR
jgi:hypothetical protein